MAFEVSSQVFADENKEEPVTKITIPSETPPPAATPPAAGADEVNYIARAQWLRAAMLGANEGLVTVASLMIGVGAVNKGTKAMLVSGLAGLVAGACSMAIGEFVSVYAQYDIEVAEKERRARDGEGEGAAPEEPMSNPAAAALASALSFVIGALLPLLAGGFIESLGVRLAAVAAVSSFGLAAFGVTGAILGGANVRKSAIRVLIGGWLAMLVTYGVIRRIFGLTFDLNISSAN